LVIKLTLSDDIRRVSVDSKSLSFISLKSTIKRIYKTLPDDDAQNLVIRYQDDEGDWITLESDEEISEALSFVKEDRVLRLTLTLSPKKQVENGPECSRGGCGKWRKWHQYNQALLQDGQNQEAGSEGQNEGFPCRFGGWKRWHQFHHGPHQEGQAAGHDGQEGEFPPHFRGGWRRRHQFHHGPHQEGQAAGHDGQEGEFPPHFRGGWRHWQQFHHGPHQAGQEEGHEQRGPCHWKRWAQGQEGQEGQRGHCRKWKKWGGKRAKFFFLQQQGIRLMETGTRENITAARDLFRMQLSIFEHNIPLYNIACCEALLGNGKEALVYLQKAVAAGYIDADHMENDEDLKSLCDLNEFQAIVLSLKSAKTTTTSNASATAISDAPVTPAPVPAIPVSVQPVIPSAPAETQVVHAPEDPSLSLLESMGFTDKPRNLDALARAKGDITTAVQILINEHQGHQPRQHPHWF